MKRIILIIMIFSVISCSVFAKKKKSKPPEWLESPKSIYPEQLYLSAMGEGDSRTMAEDYAAANLAKIFKSQVSTDETFSQRYQELTRKGSTTFEDQTDVVKNVNIKADETLFNIQFSDSYTDEYGIVHVIAYLNRFKTGELYETKIKKNEADVLYYLSESDNSEDAIYQYAALSAASVFSQDNEILLDQLLIISPDTYEFIELEYEPTTISKQLGQKSREIGFAVNVANVTREDIQGFLSAASVSNIKPEVSVYSMKDANQALLELKNRKIRGAKVLKIA